MTEEHKFCTGCGANLPEGAQFCPECGKGVNGSTNPYQTYGGPNQYGQPVGKSTIPTFILFYGVAGLVYGLIMLVESASLSEEYWNEMIEMISNISGIDASQYFPVWSDSIRTTMIVSSIFGTVSPLCALVSYYFCWKNGPWKNAMIFCGLATALILGIGIATQFLWTGVLLFIIGLYVTYRLYLDKDRYAS